ncbi:MAG: hypothetical protein Q9191_005689 [Dirinaria sp. TL-2023a]
MPSNLRYSSISPSIESTQITRTAISSPIEKKQKMSLTQTYYLAHTARGKLSKEAAKADHDLHRLVGHANLLDGLMLDLADAEREQERWFNQTVKGAAKASEEPEKPKHIQWADAIPEEAVEDEDYEASDSDSDSDDDEITYTQPMARRYPEAPATITAMEIDEDMEDDDEEFDEDLALTRTSSHPPELLHESDSESEDEPMPPSPPAPEFHLDAFSEKQRQAIATTSFYPSKKSDVTQLSASEQDSFFDKGFYIPQKPQGLVSAISVY